MISRVETQVTACPLPIARRRKTTASDEPGPSTSQFQKTITPKFDKKHLDEKLCYALSKGQTVQVCDGVMQNSDSSGGFPYVATPSREGTYDGNSSGASSEQLIQFLIPHTRLKALR